MNKVFLDNLPRKYGIGINKDKMVIDWKLSIGSKIKFVYDGIEGEIKIIDYYKKKGKNYLMIKYKNNVDYIDISSFRLCRIGRILGKINYKYKYKVGDIITNVNSGKLQILEQIKILKKKKKIKGYKYRCLICNNEDIISEDHLKYKQGCTVCSNFKIKIGYNDMWTANPDLAKLLLNPEDGYKYTKGSRKSVDWKCHVCGNIIKNKRINMINQYGLSCPKCGDGISYSEKIMYNVLQQLNIDFTYQLSKANFDWCDNYRYDFYFKINNEEYIIEINGKGHYEEGFGKCGGRSLREEQENDRNKKELAIKNNIKEKNYIVIDCSYSTLEWIKDHILNSKLNELFDLSKINWLECHKYACSSLVKKACELWNEGMYSTKEIGEIMKLCRDTIVKYLKQGVKLSWCDYNPKNHFRKVICLNNNKIFNSMKEATDYYGITSHILGCCQGKRTYCGKDPITGEKLHWMYYEDYIKENK